MPFKTDPLHAGDNPSPKPKPTQARFARQESFIEIRLPYGQTTRIQLLIGPLRDIELLAIGPFVFLSWLQGHGLDKCGI